MAKIITKETKPGPGIPKDEPEKRRFFLFFEILGEKIGKLIQLNFIYTISLIPLLTGLYFSVSLNRDLQSLADLTRMPVFTINPDYISLIIIVLSVFITGPATAGFVFVLRNMQRREHAWVWSDFWAQFKKNYLQGVAMAAIDIVAYTLLYVAFNFYMFIMPEDMPETGLIMPKLASGFIAAITIVFTWAHYYIYTMMVTFKLRLDKILKNSFVFALGKLPNNILITLVLGAILIGCLYLFVFSSMALALIVACILLSLMGYVVVFITYPTIDSNMIQRAQKQTRVLNTKDI